MSGARDKRVSVTVVLNRHGPTLMPDRVARGWRAPDTPLALGPTSFPPRNFDHLARNIVHVRAHPASDHPRSFRFFYYTSPPSGNTYAGLSSAAADVMHRTCACAKRLMIQRIIASETSI